MRLLFRSGEVSCVPTPGVLALAVGLLLMSACTARQLATVEDKAPPTIRILEPTEGARVETATPAIEIEYADDRSGSSVVSFRALVNATDYSADFDHHSRGATGRISSARPLPLGRNRLSVELADRVGNVGRAEVSFLNASGGWLEVGIPPEAQPRRSVELVLDASGSMQAGVGASTRMDVAKDAIKSLVETLPADIPLGLRVFRGCDSITPLVPIQPVDKAAFITQVQAIDPYGGTPIVASLLQSFDRLSQIREGERLTVLVTDGGESCAGSLVQAANRAKDAAVRLIVIAVDIPDQETREEFRKLAESTGGVLVNVDAGNPAALRRALEESVRRLSYEILDALGRRVADGNVNGDPLALPVGAYRLRLVMVPPAVVDGVRVGSLTRTRVEFRRAGPGLAAQIQGPTPAPGTN